MIYYITGGERSGKSRYAQELAGQLSVRPLYIATARRWDEDFEQRITRHQHERDHRWRSIECEKDLDQLTIEGETAVIDCVTLWLTNIFVDAKCDLQQSLTEATQILNRFLAKDATLLIISNEIGMGVHASTQSGRKFTELQGWVNQYIAARADTCILMVSGIPLFLKEKKHATN